MVFGDVVGLCVCCFVLVLTACCILLHLLYPRRLQLDILETVHGTMVPFISPRLRNRAPGRVQRISDHRGTDMRYLQGSLSPDLSPHFRVPKDGRLRREWGKGSCRNTARPSAEPQRVIVRRPNILTAVQGIFWVVETVFRTVA